MNASPARTSVVRVAGGRTQLVGLVAAGGALLSAPFAPLMHDIPLAALAGILFYVASRLIKFHTLRQIARVDFLEFALAIITALAVILVGVQEGIGVAVFLAILDQNRRSARPRSVVLGRHPNSTSWEPLGGGDATPVDHVAVMLFSAPLYFANASIFRAEVHSILHQYPAARHLVLDAAALSDIDFTGLNALAAVVSDLKREGIDVVLARANDIVLHALSRAPSTELNEMRSYRTVEHAVQAVDS